MPATPAADPQRDLHITEKRLQHLLQSGLIRLFDEKDIKTGEYVRDIKYLDQIVPYGELVAVPINMSRRWVRWL